MEIGLLETEVDFVFKKIFGNKKRPEILISLEEEIKFLSKN